MSEVAIETYTERVTAQVDSIYSKATEQLNTVSDYSQLISLRSELTTTKNYLEGYATIAHQNSSFGLRNTIPAQPNFNGFSEPASAIISIIEEQMTPGDEGGNLAVLQTIKHSFEASDRVFANGAYKNTLVTLPQAES